MIVKKSDGLIEDYDVLKVKNGIRDAYTSCGETVDNGVIESISANLIIYDKIETSEIRRQVEDALISVNKKVAKAYIKKYDVIVEGKKQIKKKNDFINNYIKASNAATGSKFDSNANVVSKNVVTMGQEMYKDNNIRQNRWMIRDKMKSMYNKKLADSYISDLESHRLYKHDETAIPGMPYCVAITMYPYLVDGLTKLGGSSTKPTDLKSYCGGFVNLVYSVSSQFAGACLYKDQKLVIKNTNEIISITSEDFINQFQLTNKFENYQGEWEYLDISNYDYHVSENGKYVDVKKVYRRKYNDLIYKIKSMSGAVAYTSKDHRFKTCINNREVDFKAEQLKVDDYVYVNHNQELNFDENEVFLDKIISIETFMNDDEYVYEIETSTHWYNCGGFITHNCATPEFLMYMDYFIRNDYGQDYLTHLSDKVEYNKKERSLEKVIENCFQQVVHSMNMPAGNRG